MVFYEICRSEGVQLMNSFSRLARGCDRGLSATGSDHIHKACEENASGGHIGLTVDLEDWYHGLSSVTGESTVRNDTELLLEAFSTFDVKATFFTLADVASQNKALVRKISESGHEIGFHGDTHELLHAVEPAKFRNGLKQGKHLLQDLTGKQVKGFRAPFFSLTARTCWAIGILAESGFEYDSSVYPGYNDRYGWSGAPVEPFRFMPAGMVEFPVPLTRKWFRIGFSGGAYLRMLPWKMIRRELNSHRKGNMTGLIYIHPWEYSGCVPRIWRRNIRAGLTRYPGLKRCRARVDRVLSLYSRSMVPLEDIACSLERVPDYWPLNTP
jgi:polysaccharide deacetylase family protein (PEP-CTERM system associated)